MDVRPVGSVEEARDALAFAHAMSPDLRERGWPRGGDFYPSRFASEGDLQIVAVDGRIVGIARASVNPGGTDATVGEVGKRLD